MAKILLLIGDKPESESEGLYTFEKLQQLGRDEYSYARYRDIEFIMTSNRVNVTNRGVDLTKYDLVYIRDFHGYEPERNTIADYCKEKSISFVDSDTAISQKISKLAQYMRFAFTGVPFPDSVYAHTSRLAQIAEETFSYPMIVKSIVASSGNDNYYVTSRTQLDAILAKHPHVKFIAQEAIPNDGDYRVIVLGNDAATVYRRIAQEDDHRNNIGKGGNSQRLSGAKVSSKMQSLAVRAAHAAGRAICGVDVMIDKRDGSMKVLEVNFNFGVQAAPEELFGEMASYLHEQATMKE